MCSNAKLRIMTLKERRIMNLTNKTILITGAAGFIGSYLAKRVCAENPDAKIIGFDSINDYYDTSLKDYRLERLEQFNNFTFIKISTYNIQKNIF